MVDLDRYAPYLVVGLGAVLMAVIPELIEDSASREVMLALSVGGGVLLWLGAMWDDVKRRARCLDERLAEIHYRAGYTAFWSLIALFTTIGIATSNADLTPPLGYVLGGGLFVGFVVFMATIALLKRRM